MNEVKGAQLGLDSHFTFTRVTEDIIHGSLRLYWVARIGVYRDSTFCAFFGIYISP